MDTQKEVINILLDSTCSTQQSVKAEHIANTTSTVMPPSLKKKQKLLLNYLHHEVCIHSIYKNRVTSSKKKSNPFPDD